MAAKRKASGLEIPPPDPHHNVTPAVTWKLSRAGIEALKQERETMRGRTLSQSSTDVIRRLRRGEVSPSPPAR